MKYLLDTTALLELLRATPPRTLLDHLQPPQQESHWTSAISTTELLLAGRRADNPRVMQNVVRLLDTLQVAAYDLQAAQHFAKWRVTSNQSMPTEDLMIAATAASRGLTLLTSRAAYFDGLPSLQTADWTL